MPEQLGNTAPAPPAESHEGLDAITDTLNRLEPVDPELIGALKHAREAGAVTPSHYGYGERIDPHEQPEAQGVSIALRDISSMSEPMRAHYAPGVLEISAHEWAEDDKGRTVVTGTVVMDEKGKLAPTTELTYPTDASGAPIPGRQGNVVRTIRPHRGRIMVHEEREGAGNPLKIRAMAINTAHKIAGQDQAPEVPDTPEAVAA